MIPCVTRKNDIAVIYWVINQPDWSYPTAVSLFLSTAWDPIVFDFIQKLKFSFTSIILDTLQQFYRNSWPKVRCGFRSKKLSLLKNLKIVYWSKVRSFFRCWVLRKHSKTSLYSLYLDSLNSVKATMGSINYWLAMKTRFVSEKWKFWYKVLIKRALLKLFRSKNLKLS